MQRGNVALSILTTESRTIIVAELELREVRGKVLRAKLVVRADHATVKEAPDRFDGVGVNNAVDIFLCMMHPLVFKRSFERFLVCAEFVGDDKFRIFFVGDGTTAVNVTIQSLTLDKGHATGGDGGNGVGVDVQHRVDVPGARHRRNGDLGVARGDRWRI